MEEIIKEAIEKFHYYHNRKFIKHWEYDVLSHYKWVVSNIHSLRKRIRAGIVKRTGKPYKPITLKGYKRNLQDYENLMCIEKLAIKMLIDHGYFGKKQQPNVTSLTCFRAEKKDSDTRLDPEIEIMETVAGMSGDTKAKFSRALMLTRNGMPAERALYKSGFVEAWNRER